MLHLRILVPAEMTPSITSLLRREPGAVHLSIVPGAGLDPIADLVEADIEHASLAALISRLEDLGVNERGSFSFSDVIDARSEAADTARLATQSSAASSSPGTRFLPGPATTPSRRPPTSC